MSFEQEARIARLFGGDGETSGSGGVLFPEVFTGILETLWKNGPSTEKFVHHEIRDLFEHKTRRIRNRWGSAEAYTLDMLHILADGGFTVLEGELWSLTSKAVPDTRLTLLKIPGRSESRLRITFHDTRNREAREATAEYWQEIGKIIRSFEGKEYLTPVLQKAQDWSREIESFLLEAIQNPGVHPPEVERMDFSSSRKRVEGQAEWYREWVRDAGWHTQVEAWHAWNKAHPDKQISDASFCSCRNTARELVNEGKMEKRTVSFKRDTAHTEFLYTGN